LIYSRIFTCGYYKMETSWEEILKCQKQKLS
jgi:hypothetical protein